MKKSDLTGAVSSVGVKDIKDSPVANIGQAMQGKVSGVQIIDAGKPGDNVTIKIRGLGTINNTCRIKCQKSKNQTANKYGYDNRPIKRFFHKNAFQLIRITADKSFFKVLKLFIAFFTENMFNFARILFSCFFRYV